MKNQLAFFLISLLFLPSSYAQRGYNSASISMGKVSAQHRRIPVPDEIHITEYLNYHTHMLPLPAYGEKVRLDLQVSHTNAFAHRYRMERHHVLQLGFTTPTHADLTQSDKAANLCLLVDRSGSMQGERIELVKNALRAFVEGLGPQDMVSLVVFDHEAEVIVPARAGNQRELLSAINHLSTRGSTNMSAGVDKACTQLMKHFHVNQTNRVIILTDAMINTGELSPQAILANHASEHDVRLQEHVDFSLIGVGINFDHQFARTFTSNAHNSIHFINDHQDIKKVFVDEAVSLKSVAARQVEVKLFIEGQEICFATRKVYGLDQPKDRYTWKLQDMNYGLTQVGLIAFTLGELCWEGKKYLDITAVLTYYDPETGETRTQSQKVKIRPNEAPVNFDIEKNWVIANLAQALKSMSLSVKQNPDQQFNEANKIIDTALKEVESHPRFLRDNDVLFVYRQVKAYQRDLELAYGKG